MACLSTTARDAVAPCPPPFKNTSTKEAQEQTRGQTGYCPESEDYPRNQRAPRLIAHNPFDITSVWIANKAPRVEVGVPKAPRGNVGPIEHQVSFTVDGLLPHVCLLVWVDKGRPNLRWGVMGQNHNTLPGLHCCCDSPAVTIRTHNVLHVIFTPLVVHRESVRDYICRFRL